MSFHYKIYGLHLQSSRKISLLEETIASPVDITIDFIENANAVPYNDLNWQPVSSPGLETRKIISFFTAQTNDGIFYKLTYDTEIGGFSVLVNPEKNRAWICFGAIPFLDLESFFVGTIMGALLRLRDTLCLHASVVVINGKAVAFLGQKKSGKSTNAAAFARLGYGVLADDIAVIKEENGEFYIQPGYPRLRLRPQTLEAMHPDETHELQAVNSRTPTRYANITDIFCTGPLPLSAVFIISPGTVDIQKSSVYPLTLPERLVHLGKNTFGNYVIRPENRKKEFDLLIKLATGIPVNRLQIVYDITKLNEQCETVLKNINQLN